MIRDVLIGQRREIERIRKEKYVKRDIRIPGERSNLIKVIMGPRRSGKSYFAVHFLNRLGNFGYVNFDDERLVGTKDYDDIVENVKQIYNHPKILLLDEIQNLDRWELFVNRLQRQGFNLFITGSNSKLLSQELATVLTGRHFEVFVFPFSFREYLVAKTGKEPKELPTSEIKSMVYNYVSLGGFPEPLMKDLDHKSYLSTLFDSILYKDIVKRYRIRYPKEIEELAYTLISNHSREISLNKIKKLASLRSIVTVKKYLSYLEEAFLVFQIKRFSWKVKEQIKMPRKIYVIDNGFIHAKAFKPSEDYGYLFENIVAIELKKREIQKMMDVFYYKSMLRGYEVDFVIKEGHKIKELIQVCYRTDEDAKKRETRSLLHASRELKCKNLTIITDDYEGEEEAKWFGTQRKIKFLPLWKWIVTLDKT